MVGYAVAVLEAKGRLLLLYFFFFFLFFFWKINKYDRVDDFFPKESGGTRDKVE